MLSLTSAHTAIQSYDTRMSVFVPYYLKSTSRNSCNGELANNRSGNVSYITNCSQLHRLIIASLIMWTNNLYVGYSHTIYMFYCYLNSIIIHLQNSFYPGQGCSRYRASPGIIGCKAGIQQGHTHLHS